MTHFFFAFYTYAGLYGSTPSQEDRRGMMYHTENCDLIRGLLNLALNNCKSPQICTICYSQGQY